MSDAAAVDPALQPLLDKAARLQRRLKFRKATDATLEKRLAGYRTEIARLVPQSAGAAAIATATKGGGTSYTFAAAGGATVRVTHPAAKLIGRVAGELAAQLMKICGHQFCTLFATHHTCAPNFRQLAHEQLPDKETAKQVIALCEEKAQPTVTIS